ncbi:MAG: acetoin:2,6-dichlorophenolindophenol oxidoreductase subunit beta [Thermococcaceae archaeon]|jgi:pyruvate dehydrogenase E1 component beta subunit|nr:acetoin:2,6-dichlorophenolindophenol oxidoreductase subunit beta [Thermococcaceae archaeon]MDK2853441.1 acetoin:2,6-dichlorophenolindophenol oxidoreductase subunit beta [Thermococcaceae archaeon]MDK2982979.1 acetoin:2,6-dichlorophenolindophenol oxidoreductase subunit beta [Thermococcaceae archaeon]MDN5319641.1 acetoin:2,6-dichlorophenolindophenol oxidoreductase subunit beta [Thermococcaceae archaeon]
MAVVREITFAQALNEALDYEMSKDPKVVVMGEDVGKYGGIFGVTKGLIEKYGEERVRDTPIAESGFVGTAVGAAASGLLRPVVELMFIDFLGVAYDQIYNQAAKMRYMFGGKAKIPMVIRTVSGAGASAAAQHSQSLHALFVHVPGLKVVYPSTPYDAKGLLISSIEDDDPVVFIEHKMLYGIKGPVPEEPYSIPLGEADVKKEGKDVTVVATAWMVHKALEAANKLEEEGVSVEVVDPRSLVPLDEETILNSIKKTGRLVVVDEAYPRCSFATDIAALAVNKAFDSLKAPVKLVTAPATPVPFSPALEKEWIPSTEKIEEAIRDVL